MKTITFTIAALLLSISVFCQIEIKLEDISKHVGDSVKVCTKIYGAIYLNRSKGTPTFLNAGANYPNNPLTLVIWADARKGFENKPEEFYKNKEVCIFGKVVLYKDKAQIVIYSKGQMVVQE